MVVVPAMSKIYRDDVTGKEYDRENELSQFAVVTNDMLFDEIDVADETVNNNPDAIAEKLHEMVDAWREDWEKHHDEHLTECHSCGYKWEYSGDKSKATCPDCGNKTQV